MVDSRVLDVDSADGLNQGSRVNSAIDVMVTAQAGRDLAKAPIAVAARLDEEHAPIRRGIGPRRRVRLVDENEATVAYLGETGLLSSSGATIVIDCGDSGMSVYQVCPQSHAINGLVRTDVLSGRQLDQRLAQAVAERDGVRRPTAELTASCRIAKEDLFGVDARIGASAIKLTEADVVEAAEPLVADAVAFVKSYLRQHADAGQRAIVVGGLANIPIIVDRLGEAVGDGALSTTSPELVGALGAALLARENSSGITKLAVIGGQRNREWLTLAPVVVVGVAAGVIAMSVYASGTLTAPDEPSVPAPSPSAVTDVLHLITRTTDPDTVEPPTQSVSNSDNGAGPGWETTPLAPSTNGHTKTLIPTKLPGEASSKSSTQPPSTSETTTRPSIPFMPSGIPLPSNLIPSGLIPTPSPAPRPENAPAQPSTPKPRAKAPTSSQSNTPTSEVPKR